MRGMFGIDATLSGLMDFGIDTQGRPSGNRANPGLSDCNPFRIAWTKLVPFLGEVLQSFGMAGAKRSLSVRGGSG
jgi:hypothetical protein